MLQTFYLVFFCRDISLVIAWVQKSGFPNCMSVFMYAELEKKLHNKCLPNLKHVCQQIKFWKMLKNNPLFGQSLSLTYFKITYTIYAKYTINQKLGFKASPKFIFQNWQPNFTKKIYIHCSIIQFLVI